MRQLLWSSRWDTGGKVLACWVLAQLPLFVVHITFVELFDLWQLETAGVFCLASLVSLVGLWAVFRRATSPIKAKKIPAEGGPHKLVGRVRSLPGAAVKTYTSEEPCVAASLLLGSLRGLTYLRSTRSAEFTLELQDGTAVMIQGGVWVQRRRGVRGGWRMPELIKELRLHPRLATLPAVVVEHVLQQGDWVELSGEPGFEEAATYRGGGSMRPVLATVLKAPK